MQIAVVIGTIWATRKEDRLSGLKLLILRPLNLLDRDAPRDPIIAADIIGAGVGETVLVVCGSSARSAAGDMSIPVDASVVGIVDDMDIDTSI